MIGRPAINERASLDRRIRAIETYLHAHLSDPDRLSEREAARIANVSPGHLCRVFRDVVGAPFMDWQCAIRTVQAKHLIVEGALLLEAVGRAVGYEHYETFSRMFKRYEGVSPKWLRPFILEYPQLASVVCSHTAALSFPMARLNAESLTLLRKTAELLLRYQARSKKTVKSVKR